MPLDLSALDSTSLYTMTSIFDDAFMSDASLVGLPEDEASDFSKFANVSDIYERWVQANEEVSQCVSSVESGETEVKAAKEAAEKEPKNRFLSRRLENAQKALEAVRVELAKAVGDRKAIGEEATPLIVKFVSGSGLSGLCALTVFSSATRRGFRTWRVCHLRRLRCPCRPTRSPTTARRRRRRSNRGRRARASRRARRWPTNPTRSGPRG